MQPAIRPTPAARNETVTMRKPALSGAGRSAVLTPVTARRVLSVPVLPTIVAELFASVIRSFTCVFSERECDSQRPIAPSSPTEPALATGAPNDDEAKARAAPFPLWG